MKISSSDQIHGSESLKRKSETQGIEQPSAKGPESKEIKNHLQGDRIEISGQAREILQASEIVRMTPDIRASKVEEIKRAVDNGLYQVDSDKTAGRILDQMKEEMPGM